MNTAVTTVGATISAPAKLVAALAIIAGLGIVFITGFSNSATLHNAAHDYRHSMAFPCH